MKIFVRVAAALVLLFIVSMIGCYKYFYGRGFHTVHKELIPIEAQVRSEYSPDLLMHPGLIGNLEHIPSNEIKIVIYLNSLSPDSDSAAFEDRVIQLTDSLTTFTVGNYTFSYQSYEKDKAVLGKKYKILTKNYSRDRIDKR